MIDYLKADAIRTQLLDKRYQIAFDRVLVCGIEHHVRRRQETEHRADVDDATAALMPHVRNDSARHPDDSEEVRIEDCPRLFDRALFRSGGGDAESRVVHEQVDAALPSH